MTYAKPPLLVTLGAAERDALDRARDAGRPGYWDSVNALLETAADVAGAQGVELASVRHTLGEIASDILATVRQARAYLAKTQGANDR
jgi:hypothetical protein